MGYNFTICNGSRFTAKFSQYRRNLVDYCIGCLPLVKRLYSPPALDGTGPKSQSPQGKHVKWPCFKCLFHSYIFHAPYLRNGYITHCVVIFFYPYSSGKSYPRNTGSTTRDSTRARPTYNWNALTYTTTKGPVRNDRRAYVTRRRNKRRSH